MGGEGSAACVGRRQASARRRQPLPDASLGEGTPGVPTQAAVTWGSPVGEYGRARPLCGGQLRSRSQAPAWEREESHRAPGVKRPYRPRTALLRPWAEASALTAPRLPPSGFDRGAGRHQGEARPGRRSARLWSPTRVALAALRVLRRRCPHPRARDAAGQAAETPPSPLALRAPRLSRSAEESACRRAVREAPTETLIPQLSDLVAASARRGRRPRRSPSRLPCDQWPRCASQKATEATGERSRGPDGHRTR